MELIFFKMPYPFQNFTGAMPWKHIIVNFQTNNVDAVLNFNSCSFFKNCESEFLVKCNCIMSLTTFPCLCSHAESLKLLKIFKSTKISAFTHIKHYFQFVISWLTPCHECSKKFDLHGRAVLILARDFVTNYVILCNSLLC